jgi:hypothetical protein
LLPPSELEDKVACEKPDFITAATSFRRTNTRSVVKDEAVQKGKVVPVLN